MATKAEILEKKIEDAFQPIFPSWEMMPIPKENIKSLASEFESLARLVGALCPEGRETSIAMTKLEEAFFFAAASQMRMFPALEVKEDTVSRSPEQKQFEKEMGLEKDAKNEGPFASPDYVPGS